MMCNTLHTHKMPNMERTLFLIILPLLISGCGPQDKLHREEAEQLVQQLKASPTVEMQLHFNGQKFEGQLSPQGVNELSMMIAEATPDQSPLKYAELGEITYQAANGGQGKLLFLYISELEAGLRLDGGTYFRKLDPSKLKKLLTDSGQ
jgi:hypothetical protein